MTEFRLLRLKEVMKITTLSKSTIYRRVKDKSFPEPLDLGSNIAAWRECDVEKFINGDKQSKRNPSGLEDTSEQDEFTYLLNPNVRPYDGVVETHSPQNTQLARMKGRASEHYFASQYYEWADSEDLQLAEPTVDKGWDFMIVKNGKKLQVKRFNSKNKNSNKNNVKLKRCRTSPKRGTTCHNNYDEFSFDYLVVHDVLTGKIIVADKKECFYENGQCKTSVSVYPTRKSKGLTDLGFEVFR